MAFANQQRAAAAVTRWSGRVGQWLALAGAAVYRRRARRGKYHSSLRPESELAPSPTDHASLTSEGLFPVFHVASKLRGERGLVRWAGRGGLEPTGTQSSTAWLAKATQGGPETAARFVGHTARAPRPQLAGSRFLVLAAAALMTKFCLLSGRQFSLAHLLICGLAGGARPGLSVAPKRGLYDGNLFPIHAGQC